MCLNRMSCLYLQEPPSEPRNVRIVFTTSTTIILEWDPPLSLGGRNDTMYILWYQVAGSNQEVNPIIEGPTISTTMGTITGNYQEQLY